MPRWTHPAHGTPKSPSLTPKGKPISNRRIDQLIREGRYGEELRLIQEVKDARKTNKPTTVRKVFKILGADDL
jgi:hypothetical protein